ncbi:UvrD-like helicase, ATP-binding domain, P-loop containing nucleoside triphosphate hydrolase [Tanacetum coccineum]
MDKAGSSFGVAEHHEDEFTKLILSWSLDHILNQDVYKNKVQTIPLTFESEHHYFGSFAYPLLEETRFELASSMDIIDRAPFADILSINESQKVCEKYDLLDGKPSKTISDFAALGKETWALFNVIDDNLVTDYGYVVYGLRSATSREAVITTFCRIQCCHTSSVEQIWGPPGTGKTMTVSVLLFILLQMKQKALTCTPTNVAIVQLASRVLSCTDIDRKYLEHRIERLAECLGPVTGWKHCIRSMIDLLENFVSGYYSFIENEFLKNNQLRNENDGRRTMLEIKSFIEFVQGRFTSFAPPLRSLSSLEYMLFQKNLVSEELEDLFNSKPLQDDSVKSCLYLLKTLQISLEGLTLPCFSNKYAIKQFCYERASVIFCTTSNSYKLHAVSMEPLNILVIDEAAQLKEAESTIPLQLPGMKHAILVGDERQLPAMVNSNVCIECGFGRSLFDRLSCLGHSKRLLNVQYRMHPSISVFPNLKFYQNQILDAQNVLSKNYENRYLSGPMFGSYSFINVVGGRDEKDDNGRSRRNMVEVAIAIKLVQNIYKAWKDSKKKLTVGVISPYVSQVVTIQQKLAHKYKNLDGFSVKVKSIDGFQGGEEDIIILSTVRSNSHGSVGFISCPQRTNVSLTRARHCLWILGNERTVTDSECIWKEVVSDARKRHCLFDADADECLKMTIIKAKKELEQLDDLVNGNSVLFKHAKWKVLFSDDFRRSFGKLTGSRLKKLVLNLLLKLSGGWRPKNISVDLCCGNSSQILKQFKVDGFYVICTIDIIKEASYVQVLKVWDILALDEISKLTKRLENIFSAYTDAFISRCAEKCLEGNLEVPMTWPTSQEIIRFRYLSDSENESKGSANPGDARRIVENSKVSESLLLMKFYSLSRGVVRHLLSGKELDLPMQVTDEQMDIIMSPKTSFIIGRSGTGKTTILTTKLFQYEQNFHIASEGIYEGESIQYRGAKVADDHQDDKMSVLRQLFVTVSPKLCYAVKQNVSHLTSVVFNIGNHLQRINLDDMDVITSEFSDIPDTFTNIPVKKYPLVITFQKFLMMLDGSLGNSFFERFRDARESSHGNCISSRSIAFQTFIRLREVTFDRFCSLYWPHFNSKLTKKLDPSRVFTEIISHIKGGLQAGDCSNGKLNYVGYCLLAESRSSTLTKEKRENVYRLYQDYEKMKTRRGEFDLGDVVNDIHHRLKNGNYDGDKMDLVYIDEVQDLSMRQISLFKYICQNVDEGFIFAGDTAQTIARGIDFRFQDIRSLFYKEFLSTKESGKHEKGLVTEIFQLKQNFRTHAAVLDLAQSVIDLIYHYFIHSVDKLEPEISLISGEAPVLLECDSDENAIVTIFGDTGTSGRIVGFGADQVILVRDDCAKTEICESVGKNALVLTILECKGLEFQDVLLYNFFGTSPLDDQWRVIYEYMKKYDWLDEKLPRSFPTFSEERHSVLCSELKQLYVAITRTRQRLWICENKEELSKPMFDYWKMRGLVQIRKLDNSVAQSMRVASTPQEWRERGKKFFYENNFVMATLCFERAGDTTWEKLAKASGLRASADQIRGTNHEAFVGYVREAAGIFESIRKFESAASCYCDLGEFERAGKLYLYKCRKIDAAAECFTLSGCHSEAAEAYAKGDQFANCLLVCKRGKLFNEGLEHIKYWKEHGNVRCKEVREIEQEFLENGALEYHENKDHKSMMKFVRAFCSIESKRVFLRSLGCLDDLLSLEEESGHFLEAAELVRSWGDVIKEADLLEKAGHFKEAAVLLLWQFDSEGTKHFAIENVVNIFESLGIFHNEEPNKHEGHVDFSLIYLGSELVSVGIKVLKTLARLYHKLDSDESAFHRSTSLLHIFEVTKSLLDCQHLNLTSHSKKKLQSFLEISRNYFNLVFPLDWRDSVSEDLISLRETDLSVNLLNERILEYGDIKGRPSYWAIGKAMMICFSCRQPLVLFEIVMRVLQEEPLWKTCFEKYWNNGKKGTFVVRELQQALDDTFTPKCKCPGHIAPHSFMYLLDHLLFFASLSSDIIFTSKSSLVGWLTSFDSAGTLNTSLPVSKQTISDDTVRFIVKIAKEIFYNKDKTAAWIKKSKVCRTHYPPILALKLMMILSLVCLQICDCSKVLLDLLLDGDNVAKLLPNKFVSDLIRRRDGDCLNLNPEVVSEAFLSVEDPLLIVSSRDVSPLINAPCAIFVDLMKSKEEIMSELFPPKNVPSVQNHHSDGCGTSPEATCSTMSQELNDGKIVVSDKKTDEDDSQVKVVLTNESCGCNTQEAKNKKGTGNNKKIKRGKGKKVNDSIKL